VNVLTQSTSGCENKRWCHFIICRNTYESYLDIVTCMRWENSSSWGAKFMMKTWRVHQLGTLYFMLFSGLLIYPWKFLVISQWKLSKYNFTVFNDETTFLRFSPCGTSILFLLTILTMSGCLKKKQNWNW
jgi:hypothetical protein